MYLYIYIYIYIYTYLRCESVKCISYIGTSALPDISALALGHHAYVSGKALVPGI